MPLPTPDLDDQTFTALVEEATRLVPRQSPAWTDHNRHDPGITIIELFAWLTEMQQYYLNRVRRASYSKFLKLLGYGPAAATAARTEVTFMCSAAETQGVMAPRGTPLAAGDQIFETVEPLLAVPVSMEKVISFTQAGPKDYSEANATEGLSFPAFGPTAEAGSRLYLGFDRAFPEGQRISLTFNLAEDYPVARGIHDDESFAVTPSALVGWEYYNGVGWAPLDLVARLAEQISTATQGANVQEPLYASQRRQLLTWVDGAGLTAAQQGYLAARIAGAGRIADLLRLLSDPELLLWQDETLMLSRSGRLFFTAPRDMQLRAVEPFPDQLYWLRATVRQAGYELPPRGDTVLLNTVAAVQRETFSEVLTFSGTGQANQTFSAASYLALTGSRQLQVQEPGGRWYDWEQRPDLASSGPDDRCYRLDINAEIPAVTISFGDGTHGAIPPAGIANIRLIAYAAKFSRQRLPGRSNGLPNQSFFLDHTPVCDNLLIQVEELEVGASQKHAFWRDWTRVDDRDASGPGDRHFTLDAETGRVSFGDGINGAVPPALADPADPARKNIRVIVYQAGGGPGGNLLDHTLNKIVLPTPLPVAVASLATLTVTNRRPATGGATPPALDAIKAQARSELKIPFQAVTSADYEYLACHTPGLRVARARAIPLFAPGTSGYPQTTTPAGVTVVVVPYSETARPTPSPGFLQTVCRHLDHHRLVTTRVSTVPPDYIQVSVQASLLLRAGFDPAAKRVAITSALNTFLHPLDGGPAGAGWPFGRTVYKAEIYQLIEQIDGVDCVTRVVLSAVGARRETDGNIAIPPQSLVYPGEHQIEISVPDPVCR